MGASASVLFGGLLLVAFVYFQFGHRTRGSPLPGPKGYPIIGTILPRESPWVKMTEYSKQFGAWLRQFELGV